MEDYFNFDVTYVMNITDIDDKVRGNELKKQRKEKSHREGEIGRERKNRQRFKF